MTRNLPLIFTLTFICFYCSAQITVTSESFPEIGDTLKTAIDAEPSNIVLGGPGEDKVWDFSSLQGITSQVVISDTTGVPGASEFPTANRVITNEVGNAFYRSNDNAYSLLGLSGSDITGLGVGLIAKYDPIIVERRAPLNFFDVNNDDYALNVAFDYDDLPAPLTDSIGLPIDSVRVSRVSERLDIVDAWGTLTIPDGNYEVLREKRIEEVETFLEVKIGIGQLAFWQPVNDFIPMLDEFLGVDTIVTYSFFSNDAKEPIAVVRVDPVDEITPVSVTYKSSDEITTSVEELPEVEIEILVYPNPAIDLVNFKLSNLRTGIYKLRVYNILGSEVHQTDHFVNGLTKLEIDLSHLRKGTYLYNLTDDEGNNITTKRLIITRP